MVERPIMQVRNSEISASCLLEHDLTHPCRRVAGWALISQVLPYVPAFVSDLDSIIYSVCLLRIYLALPTLIYYSSLYCKEIEKLANGLAVWCSGISQHLQ